VPGRRRDAVSLLKVASLPVKLQSAKPYLIAIVAVLAGWCFQSIVGPEFGTVFAFAPFLVASMAAAWLGGLGPTLLAMAAGYVIVTWFYVSPGTIATLGKDNLAALTIYLLLGFSSGLLAEFVHRARRAAEASEERFRLALDAGSMGVWDWDIAGNKLNWSERVYEIHGVDPAAFRGRVEDFTDLIHPDDAARVSRAIDDTLAGAAPYHIEFRIVRPSGEPRWLFTSGRVVRDESGRPNRMLGATIDTTERKKAEETLKLLSEVSAATAALVDVRRTMQTLARLSVPFFADTCAVDLVNPSGRIERLAYAHADPAKESSLKELAERFAIDWNSASPAVRVLRCGKPEFVENVGASHIDSLAVSDDHRRLLEELNPRSYIVAPLVSRGQAIGAISFAFSTSARRYSVGDVAVAQELARRAATAVENARLYQGLQEAHRQKDDFLAMLAHELRNPLAAIDYAMQLSRLAPAHGPEAEEIIERQVRQLIHLIDDLLDVSRITRDRIQLQKERLDAALTIGRAVATAQPAIKKGNHRLVVELADEPLTILADPTRVEQIVVNLLNNAAKYTPNNGEISIRAYADNEQLVIKVKDTGIGIPPEMMSRVFELFTQVNPGLDRSQGGLGIGLTVVRRLTEMHGGSVSATSEGPGTGSEFTVRLPLVRDLVASPPL
jgi:PAS domain S-box-containing protein